MGLGKLVNAAKSVGSSILGNSYRKSVLNDYSVVEKATFTLVTFEATNSSKVHSTETIPVQINPNDISFNYTHIPSLPIGGLDSAGLSAKNAQSWRESSSLSITLFYDFYDEYYARSMDGVLGSLSDFHLKNKEYSSLERLVEFSTSSPSPHVLFKWGSSIEFYGIMNALNPSYRVFSCWGQPLKADVSVSIEKIDASEEISAALSNANTGSALGKAFNTALLGAGLAKR